MEQIRQAAADSGEVTGLSGIKKGIRYIRKKYRSVGLKTQVLAYLFLLAFLPFVLIILYLWHYCSSSFSSTIRSSSLESYRTKARQIELYVDDFLQLADRIEEEGALAGIIGHDRNVSLTAYWIRQLMQGYALELYKDIEGVYILTGEGKEYLVSWFPEEYCLSLRNEARRKYAQLREIAERQAQGAEFYTQQSTFRGERCIAVRKWIFDGAGSACGSIVLLLAPDSLEEIANQISGENLPWGFRIGSTREALCVSPDYEALLDDGQTEECVIPRLGWTFSCVVNTGGMQQQALRKFALMLGLTILIYITIMYFVTRAVNRQLKILYRLQAEMERVSREGTLKKDRNNNIASHRFIDQLADESCLERIHNETITYDKEESERRYNLVANLVGDIVPVRLVGDQWCFDTLWDDVARLHGVGQLLEDLLDRPEYMHALARKLTDVFLDRVRQYEELNLFEGNQDLLHGTAAYTDQLPSPECDGVHFKAKDVWGRGAAQVFVSVSPAMRDEFDLPYMAEAMEPFGLVYYGCCEPLHNQIDNLTKIPHLRKITVTPWANYDLAAEQIGKKYVYSAKANPANVAMDAMSEEVIRAELKKITDACYRNGCNFELVLKDISTVSYHPEHLERWARIAKEYVTNL